MFLFYCLLCRNLLEIDKTTKQALLETDSNFPEICPHLKILDIVCLSTEDYIKWKIFDPESCGKFPYL